MKPKGTLIVIGGNEQKKFKEIDEKYHSDFGEGFILQDIVDEAGGDGSRIEVITSASSIPEAVGQNYVDSFSSLGCENVGILDIQQREEADHKNVLKRIKEADAIMFSGGDQNDISRIVKDTDVHDLICDRYLHEDFLLAGTSAGAVVMAEDMIAGGKNKNTLRKHDLKMNKGLGVLPHVILDSHFIRRRRFGRLAEAVAAHPDKLGIGLGEDTGLLIKDGTRCKIIGTGMVILFDGSHLTHNDYANLKDKVCISLANLTVHILASHDIYDIKSKRVEVYSNPQNHLEKVS